MTNKDKLAFVQKNRWRGSLFLVTLLAATTLLLGFNAKNAFARLPGEIWVMPQFSVVSGNFSSNETTPGSRGATRSQLPPTSQFGPSIELGTSLQFNDFFGIEMAADISYLFENSLGDRNLLANVSGLFRYNIDLFQFVPYALVGLGATYARTVSAPANFPAPLLYNHWDASATLGLGLDYRLNRYFSVGCVAKYRIFLLSLSDFPSQVNIGIRTTFHFTTPF